jgi:hypothetical protein
MAQNEPHVRYIYPAGGRQGSTFEATLGGRYLNATGVFFSGTGVSATITRQERQVTPTEQKELRETLSKIQEKRQQGEPVTPEEMKTAAAIRQRLTGFGRRLTNPSLGEFVTLQVTVTPTATPGNREIRLITPAGLSNPLVFQVGELPELTKKVWKDIPKAKGSMDPELNPKPPEVSISLPICLNGQIPPGGVDRYRFHAMKDQKWVVVVRARELIPYVSDAVPGWFQAVVELSDAKGQEVVPAGDYGFHPDPVLYYQAPADGDYVLEIKDSLFRGREDFVYRITLGQMPFVTAVFPLGGRIGTQSTLATSGWNLPFKTLPLDVKGKATGIQPLSQPQLGNRVLVAADSLPEAFDKEPNNTIGTAQPVTLPVILNGRIDEPGDMDVFRVNGKAGEQIIAEVIARRLDSPLDSLLAITDAAGKQLAFNDDDEDKASGLNTHHADSYLAFTFPTTGTYFIHLGDTQHSGGADFSYRLRLSAPRPDFELRVTPSSLNVHGGASTPLTVHALRKDGFTGAIALRLIDPPTGFTLTSASIPANQDQVRFTLNAAAEPISEPLSLHLEGRATIQGHEVVHPAVPADDMMQAFAYRHLVSAQELKVAVVGRFRPGDVAQVLSSTPVKIPVGGSTSIHVSMPIGPLMKNMQFELSEAPDGIRIESTTPAELVLLADPEKAKPGVKGNLIVKAFADPPTAQDDQAPSANRRRISLGALPAIPFEIVPRPKS